MDSKLEVPGIAIDLDGVVWYQGQFIDGSVETLRMLSQDLNLIDEHKYQKQGVKMPFLFLTNSGATTEQKTADSMNSKLGLPEDQRIAKEHFVLNYTPLRQEFLQFTDKLVIVSGFENTPEIMHSLGLKKYITMEEYAKLYPQLVPNNKFTKDDTERTRQILRDRIDGIQFEPFIQVHAIMLSYISNHVEVVTQLLCDLLTTNDGHIADQFPDEAPNHHIPVYSIANDYFFPSKDFSMVRLGWGMYMDAIEIIYKKAFKKDLTILRCGKPSEITFQYAQSKAKEFASINGMNISKFYMIGDNPHTDIRGAKQLGWETILVRTGVYSGQAFDSEIETPTIVVQNFKEAIEHIFKKEQIKYQL